MAIVHQQFRNLALAHDRAGWTDGQLLEGYVGCNDSAALEALVLRHGPMVWGVCCRMLNQHDAEDAFQAAFVVLAKKAAAIAQAGRRQFAEYHHMINAFPADRTDHRPAYPFGMGSEEGPADRECLLIEIFG